ncbi:MAG TPA: hypothetical protein VFR45_05120 [Nocardioides sp.]|nr:hypothetical protein [Nocardioides sp.]
MPDRALSSETLGAWLVKASGAAPQTRAHVDAGFAGVGTWCVRPTYRTDLVAAGQPVLLWISGSEPGLPAGIHAHGRTTGPARDGVMPVVLVPLEQPLLRSELVGHPDLAALEVLRMPAGSNPSYVTPAQLDVLVAMREELAERV